MIVVLAGAIDKDAHAADRLALYSAKSSIPIVASKINENANAADGLTLGNILCIVNVIAGHIDEHRNAKHNATLDARLRALIVIVSCQINDDQDGTLWGHGAFVIDIIAAQVDHRTYAGHLVEFINIVAPTANDDLACRGVNFLQHGSTDAFNLNVAFFGNLGQLGEQVRIAQRHQGVGRVKQGMAIHFL